MNWQKPGFVRVGLTFRSVLSGPTGPVSTLLQRIAHAELIKHVFFRRTR